MPEAISFVASDDLADWLRAEADRRALTVPATVQHLLAETYRDRAADGASAVDPSILEVTDAATERPDLEGTTGPTADTESGSAAASASDAGDVDTDLDAIAAEVANQGVETDALDRHPDAWTMEQRGGERLYAVRLPDGDREFYATRGAAADVIDAVYDD